MNSVLQGFFNALSSFKPISCKDLLLGPLLSVTSLPTVAAEGQLKQFFFYMTATFQMFVAVDIFTNGYRIQYEYVYIAKIGE